MNKRIDERLRLRVEVDVPALTKVKSYMRVRNGKIEMVRAYYRCILGAPVVKLRIYTR